MTDQKDARQAYGELAELAALAAHYLLKHVPTESHAESAARLVLWFITDHADLLADDAKVPCEHCGTTDKEFSWEHQRCKEEGKG